MRIVVDLSSATPQYEQIRAQVVAHIASGMLERGERLPTIRNLAADLGIAAGTVARAYRELESAGHVSTRRKIGTVVTAQGRTSGRTHDVARTLVEVARSEGVQPKSHRHPPIGAARCVVARHAPHSRCQRR